MSSSMVLKLICRPVKKSMELAQIYHNSLILLATEPVLVNLKLGQHRFDYSLNQVRDKAILEKPRVG